jgi:hypothetical protein
MLQQFLFQCNDPRKVIPFKKYVYSGEAGFADKRYGFA